MAAYIPPPHTLVVTNSMRFPVIKGADPPQQLMPLPQAPEKITPYNIISNHRIGFIAKDSTAEGIGPALLDYIICYDRI